MATTKGIISPYDRICDIAMRREIDLVNRRYFLAEFTNVLIDILKRLDLIDKNTMYIYANNDKELSDILKYFKQISEHFYEVYNQLFKENVKKKKL